MYSKCAICSLATVQFEATDVKMVFVCTFQCKVSLQTGVLAQ